MVSAVYTVNEDQAMSRRELAGMGILASQHRKIKQIGLWVYVPSESHPNRWYKTSPKYKICQCPDNTLGKNYCKHLWAATVWLSVREDV